mmetsp:Transcript_1290/g.3303  ORF Transcript_1290/g.3303 Transcript_1290/m.3303 type:complete len:229 (+) Transcript_1290:285-971(+)
MLVVTTTVRMLYWVHGHTSNLRPAVSLDLVLVVGGSGLEERLLGTASSGDLPDHGSAGRGDQLLAAAWELDSGEPGVGVVRHDEPVGARGSSDGRPVSGVPLDVADDGSLGHAADGEHVADVERGLLSGVDELALVESLGGDDELLLVLVPDGVPEGDLGERRAAAWVVDDLVDHSLDVALLLRVVEAAELGGALPRAVDRLENTAITLTLSTDDATHLAELRTHCLH